MHHLLEDTEFQLEHDCDVKPSGDDYMFIYHEQRLVLTKSNQLLHWHHLPHQPQAYYFGELNGKKCFITEVADYSDHLLVLAKRTHEFLSLAEFQAVAFGHHISHWRKTHKFCGYCGHEMQDKASERARECLSCGYVCYPRISPCVIMLVKKDDKILLARGAHVPSGIYSTLAGFIEPGESAEQAVAREIKEEVGIEVKNIQYIASQPWPFPDSLMLGFVADYAGGDIVLQENEIEDAQWFSQDNLPKLPPEISISRFLINSLV